MRLFSISAIVQQAAETLRRFPLPLLSALVAVVAMITVAHRDWAENDTHLGERVAMASYLAMLLSISVALFAERFISKRGLRIGVNALVVVLAALYFYSLPDSLEVAQGVRFAVLAIALHLLVAFAPFVFADQMNGLWQYNKSLFLRILTSGVYSAVLFGGLALALLAVDKLFELKVNDDFYFDLWLIIAGVFNTWFFLSGVPKDLPGLEQETDYPKGLKVFTLYVLIPLITIYLVILYAYVAKIILTSNWPVGWVAYLVLAFSIFGILSFLLVYPLRNDAANPWVKFYSRLFYLLLVPLIVMLYISIFKRIEEYGITVARYYVLLLALWLTFIAAYNILTGGKRIRVIPLSLCLIGLLSTFGWWGAFAVSHKSQMQELTLLLDSNGVLVNGKVETTSNHPLKAEEYDRVESIVNYIDEMHGHKELQAFFDQNIDSLNAVRMPEGGFSHRANGTILEMLHLERLEDDRSDAYSTYNIDLNVMLNNGGYDFVANLNRFNYKGHTDTTTFFVVGSDTVNIEFQKAQMSYRLTYREFEPLILNVAELLTALPRHDTQVISVDKMTTTAANSQWKVKFVITSLDVSRENGEPKIETADGILMLSFLGDMTQAPHPNSQ